MIETLIMSALAFIGTNIDDIFINTLFYSAANTKRETVKITVGVFIGIFTLFFGSLLISVALGFFPDKITSLLGIIPIFLGVKEFIVSQDEDEAVPHEISALKVALMTIAGGGDNIGVYIPLFARFTAKQFIVCAVVFTVFTALLCISAKLISKLSFIGKAVKKHRRFIIPIVYVSLGVYILLSGFFF